MPDQYDWSLWFGDEDYALPYSYVYRRDMALQDGKTYHFLTRNLQPLTPADPDPVMYLVRGNDIVAFNDDYVGYASEIIYTPTVADVYRLVIRAYTTATPGLCELYQAVGQAAPTLLESNAVFGGTYVRARWKQGEWFETGARSDVVDSGSGFGTGTISGGPAPDPYLFLIYPDHAVGSKLYWNDDGAGFPHSKIVPPSGGTGTVILGAFSRYTGGECRLALVGQSYKAPWMSPAPWAFVAEPVAPTPTVRKYLEELKRQKPEFKKLTPDERDQHVLELQRRMLSEEEIREQAAPMSAVSTELVRRQKVFSERYSQMEEDLARMSYDERAAKLAQVKRDSLGPEYSEPEASLLSESEE